MAGRRRGISSQSAPFVVLVLAVAMVAMGGWVASGDTSPSQCKEEKRLLVNACRPIIFGQNPSAACCQRVRVTNAECVCPYVTPKVAALINVPRTIKQIEGCGRTVPRNFKCGSKISLQPIHYTLHRCFMLYELIYYARKPYLEIDERVQNNKNIIT